MKKVLSKNGSGKGIKFLFTLLVIFFLLNMLIAPAKYLQTALSGLSTWATIVLPSVFPFMFFTRVLTSLGYVEKFTKPFTKFSTFLYKTSPLSFYVFFMAIMSGYPVGSKMIADLYVARKINRTDAYRMSAFCSTSGPMFIIGAVGIGMFKSATIGYILFISHVLGAMLNGLIYRNVTASDTDNDKEEQISSAGTDISSIVQSCVQSILAVGGIITIFFIIIEVFSPLFSFLPLPLSAFLEGVIEITKGSLSLSTLTSPKLAVLLCSFVIGFGGISTILQSITMLNRVKIPLKLYILQKLTHGLLSMLVSAPLLFLI